MDNLDTDRLLRIGRSGRRGRFCVEIHRPGAGLRHCSHRWAIYRARVDRSSLFCQHNIPW